MLYPFLSVRVFALSVPATLTVHKAPFEPLARSVSQAQLRELVQWCVVFFNLPPHPCALHKQAKYTNKAICGASKNSHGTHQTAATRTPLTPGFQTIELRKLVKLCW